MQSPTGTLTVRKLTIIVVPPGFILNLVHGIVSGTAFPALSSIPLAGSALLGASLLYRNQISYGGSPILLSPLNIIAVDFVLAVLHFIFLIICWVGFPQSYWHPGVVMLGTYGTVPMMLNVGCHGYLIWTELVVMTRHVRDCPNPEHHHIGRSEYTPLAGCAEASAHEDEEDGSAV